jgi:hypothetical protein
MLPTEIKNNAVSIDISQPQFLSMPFVYRPAFLEKMTLSPTSSNLKATIR